MVSRGIALPFHDLGTWMGVGGQHHAPADLPPGKGPGTHYLINLIISINGARGSAVG